MHSRLARVTLVLHSGNTNFDCQSFLTTARRLLPIHFAGSSSPTPVTIPRSLPAFFRERSLFFSLLLLLLLLGFLPPQKYRGSSTKFVKILVWHTYLPLPAFRLPRLNTCRPQDSGRLFKPARPSHRTIPRSLHLA